MDVSACKKQFAFALYSDPSNPFKAAMAVFGEDDIGSCCKYALEWKDDEEVKQEIKRISEESKIEDFIPSKLEAATLAWKLANNEWLKGKERVDALRLFSEIAGHMPDKTTNKNVNLTENSNRVMIIRESATNEEWEQKAQAQQTALVNGT